MEQLESEIAQWRAVVGRRPAVDRRDVDELEAHLRDQIADLDAAGLSTDEALLVAVRRMGSLDELSREFAREHSGRLWKQLVLAGEDERSDPERSWVEVLGFAAGAAVTVLVACLVAGFPAEQPPWLARNAALFVLPFLAGWFARRRRLDRRWVLVTAAPFVVAGLVVNLSPFQTGAATEALVAAHLPVTLWFAAAVAYTGGHVTSPERRMDVVRFPASGASTTS